MKACIVDGVLTVEFNRNEYDCIIQPAVGSCAITQMSGFRFACNVDELNPEEEPEITDTCEPLFKEN